MESRVRGWIRAGFLHATQGQTLEAELRTELRLTRTTLRAVLALFTVIAVAASVALVFTTLEYDADPLSFMLTTATAGLGCLALSEAAVARLRLYRHGVEEALGAAGVLLFSVSAATLVRILDNHHHPALTTIAALAVAALGGMALHVRFGLVYAALAALVCAAAIPLQVDVAPWVQRCLAAGVCAVVFAFASAKWRGRGDEFVQDEYATLRAGAWAGIYLVLNLQLSDIWTGLLASATRPAFYWTTFVITWAMPAIGLVSGIRSKQRLFIGVNGAMALATLASAKPYLGLTRQTWDPIVFGVGLVAMVVTLRRWLSLGPGEQRGGFTARQLAGGGDVTRWLANASIPVQAPSAPPADSWTSGFEGGRSGGGGATNTF